MTSTPSWATAPGPRRRERPRPTVALVLAAAGASVVAVGEAVHVAGRDELRPAVRVGLTLVVLGQVGLAALLLRRSAGAAIVLFLCQATAVLASPRPAYVAGAIVVAVLLARAVRDIPTPDLMP